VQAAVSSHIVFENDNEPDDSSDKETQGPIHEWQLVNKTKKMKREQSQKKDSTTNQTHIKLATCMKFFVSKTATVATNKPNQPPNPYPNHAPYSYTAS